ncbi:type II toxin-antitoxin system RelE/ParE family toxin [Janthinobacterium agaricidamnosum]|uniref:Plasmid stabilisation system family protein n=1 Tax=Janthinobacterium agaricidamnosum NBRC 102515 = DSM 9628 TaxID=1349767 RepID=W0V2A7_9BURK|nr:type II toxin-antitoxin system RelE/ParE family toxin [Janthinobacterium agaricidamnosum]CDG82001.1 plasmid stabilisation system family protein [Janthinobacterium agaricidamnosum NBRC 102515 = DSM 9628]
MNTRVVVLDEAEQDLKDLQTYLIQHFSVTTWQDSYAKIKKSIRLLKSFPQSGTVPDEIRQYGTTKYRQVLAGMNRIIYEVRADVVYIHIIVDTRRDMKSLLEKRLGQQP